jgi:hypothetical protein
VKLEARRRGVVLVLGLAVDQHVREEPEAESAASCSPVIHPSV